VARKNEAEGLIRGGLTPAEAGGKIGCSVATIVQYLRLRVKGRTITSLGNLFLFGTCPAKRWRILRDAHATYSSLISSLPGSDKQLLP